MKSKTKLIQGNELLYVLLVDLCKIKNLKTQKNPLTLSLHLCLLCKQWG